MTGALLAIDIKGVGGRLAEARPGPKGRRPIWAWRSPASPTCSSITGPGSPSVLSNMINSIEQHVEWIIDCIGYMREHGLTRIAADPETQEAWVAHVRRVADKTLFPRAASWYMGANIPGKPRVFMPYIGAGYRKKCADVAAAGYEGFALPRSRRMYTLPDRFEFLSDAWLDEARALPREGGRAAASDALAPFSLSERFADAPPHLKLPDNVGAWTCALRRRRRSPSRAASIANADVMVEGDYQAGHRRRPVHRHAGARRG